MRVCCTATPEKRVTCVANIAEEGDHVLEEHNVVIAGIRMGLEHTDIGGMGRILEWQYQWCHYY